MGHLDQEMKPSEIRKSVLDDHALLRGILEGVEELARRVLEGEFAQVSSLRERGLELHTKLCEHLDREDRLLVPALNRAGGEGPSLAKSVTREHREQRGLLEYILGRLGDESRPTVVLARELQSFVEVLSQDMLREESEMLGDDVLRDDLAGE